MIRALVVKVVLSCALAGAALVTVSMMATPALVQSPEGGTTATTTSTTDTRAAREAARVSSLLAQHGCWTDAAPAGAPEPRHAVVTPVGGKPRLVEASVGFGIWLEGRPGTLHGFCP